MDWDAARAHCKEKNWKWTLDLIEEYQKDIEELKDDRAKNPKIAEKIDNYGQNILNNVTMELKKYI